MYHNILCGGISWKTLSDGRWLIVVAVDVLDYDFLCPCFFILVSDDDSDREVFVLSSPMNTPGAVPANNATPFRDCPGSAARRRVELALGERLVFLQGFVSPRPKDGATLTSLFHNSVISISFKCSGTALTGHFTPVLIDRGHPRTSGAPQI